MTHGRVLAGVSVGLMAVLLAACGGGGSGGAISPSDPPVSTASGSDIFLLFPNPQAPPDGASPKIDSIAYAQAYYTAIDPANEKGTLSNWKAANKFDSNTGLQITAVFGDGRDLGYGRRMTARQNPDGTIAFVVENYLANPGGSYGFSQSQLSLDAAIAKDTRWLILINAVEFSPGPGGGVKFAKFFNFDPVTGQRQLAIDIDGRGDKAMPGPCITCHGGRGDALVPDASGKLGFNIVQNAASGVPGDVQAHLAPFEVDTLVFSKQAGFTRLEQESLLKTMNALVLCTYPLSSSQPTGVPSNICTRRDAVPSEWQGTAAQLIIGAYGGDGLPNPAFVDTFMPDDWSANGQRALYQNVVVPACRACHILRGTNGQSDIDLTTFAKFQAYAQFQGNAYPRNPRFDDRIKVHAIDRGNMPLAKIVYDTFWSSTSQGPPTLGAFLTSQGFSVLDATGAVLQPGRPIADPGPDRTITKTASLTAAEGQFADNFVWSVASSPVGAVFNLSNPNSPTPTFSTTTDGTYVLRLVASKGSTQSTPTFLTLVANSSLAPQPDQIRFSHIKNVLGSAICTGCHLPTPGSAAAGPPIFFADNQANVRTDDAAFYAEIRSRINFADIVASPLLRKPAGRHHGGGGPLAGFHDELAPGQSQVDPATNLAIDRANYDLFLNWILNGAPL